MNHIPEDARIALRIQEEGAENLARACSEAFEFGRSRGPRDGVSSTVELQQLYRFLAATAALWIGLKLSEYPNILRFGGLQQRMQELNCLHACRIQNLTTEIGDPYFLQLWSTMFEDLVAADEALQIAMRSGRDTALVFEYPREYFLAREGVDIRTAGALTLNGVAGIAGLVLIENIKPNLANIDAAYGGIIS